MWFTHFSIANARGFALRALIVLLVVGVGATTAVASPITQSSIPGDFFQVGATYDRPGGVFTVYSYGGRDGLTNGYVTSSAGMNYTFTCPTGFVQCGIAGYVPQSGLFVSNMVDDNFADFGYIGSVDGTVSYLLPNWQFGGVDRNGNYVGSNFGTGRATYGTLTELLLGSFSELPLGGGDFAAAGRVVNGGIHCSTNDTASGGRTRCYNGATEISLADGTNFIPRGFDSQSGLLFGSRGGCAGWLNVGAGGTFTQVPGVACGGTSVTSIVNGRATISGAAGEFFYRIPTGTLVTATAFQNELLLTVLRANLGVGDSTDYGLAGLGSSGFNSGPSIAYEPGFGETDPANIPEPATYVLTGTALGVGAWVRRRKRSQSNG